MVLFVIASVFSLLVSFLYFFFLSLTLFLIGGKDINKSLWFCRERKKKLQARLQMRLYFSASKGNGTHTFKFKRNRKEAGTSSIVVDFLYAYMHLGNVLCLHSLVLLSDFVISDNIFEILFVVAMQANKLLLVSFLDCENALAFWLTRCLYAILYQDCRA